LVLIPDSIYLLVRYTTCSLMPDTDPRPVEPTRAGPDRTLARRTALPGGRAVVGGLLVAVAALGVYTAHRQGSAGPTTTYLVAAVDLDAGARLRAADLRPEPMQLPDTVSDGTFSTAADLDGAVTLAPLRAGELLQRSAVIPPGVGDTADAPPVSEFSFALERTRAVNGALNRGERVDLLATYGTSDTARTHVVVRDALVTDIDNDAGDTIGSASTVTVTLSLPSRDDVLEAAHATQVAEVTLVRATRAGRDDPSSSLEMFGGPDTSGGPP
jgi:Flp pilus assembly protein CpaB